jgi:UDP-N-acetylmuramoyl-L-alanyl-D-glutamate--2,6-diaminopimelate ligase
MKRRAFPMIFREEMRCGKAILDSYSEHRLNLLVTVFRLSTGTALVYTVAVNTQRLSALIDGINIIERFGGGDPEISGIAYDSRDVRPGFLFFALPGIHTDGHSFIGRAISTGAAAVIHEKPLQNRASGVIHLQVPSSRAALSPVSAAFHGRPSESLTVIGVTGTDGKSTTVYLIHQLLTLLGKKSGFLSTVNFLRDTEIEENPFRQSTPEALEVHGILRAILEAGKEFAVVESTSHGLSERNCRLADVRFTAAVLTNVTHEHLEFHGSFDQYRHDKANLFRALALPEGGGGTNRNTAGLTKPAPFGVVNLSDPSARYFMEASAVPVFTYGFDAKADLWASGTTEEQHGSRFTLTYRGKETEAFLPLPGKYNIENTMAAALVVSCLLGISPLELAPLFARFLPVRGRMTPISEGQPFLVYVDYAHTPGAFEKVLPMMRKRTTGRLILVFGSAGERDREKRPLQGETASRYGDILFLTDEDPRGEDRMTILRDIAAGCRCKSEGKDLFLVPERSEAIRRALSLALPGDTVMLLGKGHESSIIGPDGKRPWDEEIETRRILRDLLGRGETRTGDNKF